MGIVSDVFGSLTKGATPGGSYKYSVIPTPPPGPDGHRRRRADDQRHPRRTKLPRLFAGATVLLAILAMAALYGRGSTAAGRCEDSGQCTDTSPHTWGQYSPFFSVHSAIDAATPAGCRLTFGLVLSRHGSRFPTSNKAEVYEMLIKRIQSSVQDYGAGFDFVEHFSLQPGADQLTLFGEKEMVDSGASFYQRYKGLAQASDPFIRASGSDRVIVSAQNFTQGFYRAQGKSGHDQIAKMVVLPEGIAFNNTLDHGTCPAFEDGPGSDLGQDKPGAWMDIWATPIMERLNSKLAGANLTLQETVFMMDLCPFGTVATPNATRSDFCKLFSRDEWRGYDYFQSLGKWYGYGRGNPLGPTQGAGYINELIARLTGHAVQDNTTTNSTLDSSPTTFPLYRKLYADFSHDNTMTSAFAALGLYNETHDLPVEYKLSPYRTHGYSASWTVPFAGRMYVEKMQCGAGEDEEEELVRILVNDRVVPLQGCGADELGRCTLSAFVESLSFARAGGLWDTCFA